MLFLPILLCGTVNGDLDVIESVTALSVPFTFAPHFRFQGGRLAWAQPLDPQGGHAGGHLQS